MSEVKRTNMPKGTVIKWCIVIVAAIALMLIPEGEIYNADIKKFAVISVAAILMIAFELLPMIIPGIFLMFGYYLTGIAPAEVAFSGWTMTATYLVLGCLVMVAALQESGLLIRFSYWCMIKFGGTYKGIVIGILICSLVLSFITMGNAYVLMSAFAIGCIYAMKINDTKMSVVIGATILLGTCTARSLFYSPMLIAVQVAQSQSVLGSDYTLSLTGIPLQNWPVIFIIIGALFVTYKMYKPERAIDGKVYFQEEYNKLGRMSAKEKRSIVFLVIIIGWLLLDTFIPLSSDYAMILLPWLMLFPVIGIAEPNKIIEKINWNVVFFVPGCFCIGSVASQLGLGQMIADAILPYIQDSGNWVFLAIVYFLTFALNFLLTPYAIHSCLTVPLLNIGLNLGIDPVLVNYMLMHGSDAVIFPYEYTQYLIIFSFGFMKMKDFIKVTSVSLVFKIIVVLGLLPVWWKIIGLL